MALNEINLPPPSDDDDLYFPPPLYPVREFITASICGVSVITFLVWLVVKVISFVWADAQWALWILGATPISQCLHAVPFLSGHI